MRKQISLFNCLHKHVKWADLFEKLLLFIVHQHLSHRFYFMFRSVHLLVCFLVMVSRIQFLAIASILMSLTIKQSLFFSSLKSSMVASNVHFFFLLKFFRRKRRYYDLPLVLLNFFCFLEKIFLNWPFFRTLLDWKFTKVLCIR